MVKPLYILVLAFILGACAPASMRLEPSVSESTEAMSVRGRHGWQLGQQLSFGPYYTDEVGRGWTVSYELPLLINLQGAQEKLSFQQFDGSGRSADVYLINAAEKDELLLLSELFRVSIVDETTLSGNVITGEGVWELLLYRPDTDIRNRAYQGFIRNRAMTFELSEVKQFEDTAFGPALPPEQPLGYEFLESGRVVGAVELIDGGRVWLDENLTEEHQLVLASVASSLLLRSELGDALR